jgi:hypothetical protein
MYKCSKCNLAVIVLEGKEPIKACKCNAPIIADMTATVKAQMGVNNNGRIQKP